AGDRADVRGAEAVSPRGPDRAAEPRATRGDLLWASIPAMAIDAAARFGDAEAMVDRGRRIGFSELVADYRRGTAALAAWGLARGPRRGVGAQPVRVGDRGARRAGRRCGARAREHSVQEPGGPAHPRAQRRARRVHDR